MVEKKALTSENVAGNSVFPIFNPTEFGAFNRRALEIASRASRAYLNGAAKYNQELMGFVSSRLKKDVEAAQALMSSKSREDAFQAQANFVEDLMKDYSEEASKILALGTEAMKDVFTPPEAP
jgi:hypothetical protein